MKKLRYFAGKWSAMAFIALVVAPLGVIILAVFLYALLLREAWDIYDE